MSKTMSLKAKIRNIAKQKNIPAQVILQTTVVQLNSLQLFLVFFITSKKTKKPKVCGTNIASSSCMLRT